MEKMNQVSVTEFMSKSKEEMYDNAVDMVEKYNRLVDICNDSAERMAELITRHKTYTNALNKDIADGNAKIERLEKEIEGRKEEIKKLNKSIMNKNEMINTVNGANANLRKEIEAHESENARLSDKIKELKETMMVEEYNHTAKYNFIKSQREIDYVHISKYNDCVKAITLRDEEIKKLKEENARLSERVDKDIVNKLIQETDYYKDQERIRTDQLRATESKVDQLYKEIDELKEENTYLKKESKNKSEMIRKAYVRYVDEACKSREEIMNECYEKLTKDDTGYTGFKLYVKNALEAQEGNEKEAKKFLCDAAEIIFRNKRSEEKRKEETEVKGIPCGEDAIE